MADEIKLGIVVEGVNDLSPILKQITKDLASFGKIVSKMKTTFNDFNKNVKESSKQTATASKVIKESITGIATSTTKLETSTKATSNSLENLNKKLLTTSRELRTIGLGMSIGITAPLVLIGKQAVKTAAVFEQSMANAFSIMGDVSKELKGELEGVARELGSTTIFTASQAADAMYKLASAGLEVEEIIGSLPGILNLAAATQSDFAEVAEQTAIAMTIFGIKADEANRITDSFATGISKSNLNFTRLKDSLKFAAPPMTAFGKSLEETVSALAFFANAGLLGRRAGSGLRNVLTGLAAPTAKAKEIFTEFGISLNQLNPELNSLGEILDTIGESGMSSSQIFEAFGDIAGNVIVLALKSAEKEGRKVSEMLTDLEVQMGATGSAAKIASVQIDTIAGAYKVVVSAIQEAFIAFQKDVFGNFIKDLLLNVADIVRSVAKLSPITKTLIVAFLGIAAAIGVILLALSALTFAITTLATGTGFWIVIIVALIASLVILGIAINSFINKTFPDKVEMAQKARESIKDPIISALLATLEESEVLVANLKINISNALSGLGVGDGKLLNTNLSKSVEQVKKASELIILEIEREGQARLDNLEILKASRAITEHEYERIKNAITSNTDASIDKHKELNEELENMSNASFNLDGLQENADRLKIIVDEMREDMISSLTDSTEEFDSIQEALTAGMLSIAEDRFKGLVELQNKESTEIVALKISEADKILKAQDSLQKELIRVREESLASEEESARQSLSNRNDFNKDAFGAEQKAIDDKIKQEKQAKDDILTIAAEQRVELNTEIAKMVAEQGGIWDAGNQKILTGWDSFWFKVKNSLGIGATSVQAVVEALIATMIDIFLIGFDSIIKGFTDFSKMIETGLTAVTDSIMTVSTDPLKKAFAEGFGAPDTDAIDSFLTKSADAWANNWDIAVGKINEKIKEVDKKVADFQGTNLEQQKILVKAQVDDLISLIDKTAPEPDPGDGPIVPPITPEATEKVEDLEKTVKDLGKALQDLGVFNIKEGGEIVDTFNSIEDGIKKVIERIQDLDKVNAETISDIDNLSNRIRANLGEITLSNDPALNSFKAITDEIKNIESAVGDLEKANQSWLNDANKGLKEYAENVANINTTFDEKIQELNEAATESISKSIESTTEDLAQKFFDVPEQTANIQDELDKIIEDVRIKELDRFKLEIDLETFINDASLEGLSEDLDTLKDIEKKEDAIRKLSNGITSLKDKESDLNNELGKLTTFKDDFEALQESARRFEGEIVKIDKAIANTDDVVARNKLEDDRILLLGKQALALGESEKLDELIANNKAKQQLSEVDFIAFKLGKEIEAINEKAAADKKALEDKRNAELKSAEDYKKIQEVISAGMLDYIDIDSLKDRGFSAESITLATKAKADFEVYKASSQEQLVLLDEVRQAQSGLFDQTKIELTDQLVVLGEYSDILEILINQLNRLKVAAEEAYKVSPNLKMTGDPGISLKPHKAGGYTGDGDVNAVAGVVHGGEWVAPQWMVKSYGSVFGMLENIRNSRGGNFEMPYKNGGTVASSSGSTYNFDFSNAVIADKDSFITDIKNSINRDSDLASQGA